MVSEGGRRRYLAALVPDSKVYKVVNRWWNLWHFWWQIYTKPNKPVGAIYQAMEPANLVLFLFSFSVHKHVKTKFSFSEKLHLTVISYQLERTNDRHGLLPS